MEENLKIIANSLDIGISTLYKWKKTREKLFSHIVENYNKKSIIENKEKSEIEKYFNELEEIEKEMYLAEIKARVLRKKIDKN
jgi:acyl CoA:acetate/3-ketoacid CoA transferase alpha subunit